MKKVTIAAVSIMLVLALSGCGQAQNNRDHANHANHANNAGMGTQSLMNKGKSTIDTYDHQMSMNNRNKSGHHNQSMLTQHVRNVEGVTDSTILVDGDNIIVGLDVDNKADRKKVEQRVRSLLLKDHNGQNVHVTSDRKFHDRIRSLNKQMTSTDGQGLNTLSTDIKVLLEDIGHSINKAVK